MYPPRNLKTLSEFPVIIPTTLTIETFTNLDVKVRRTGSKYAEEIISFGKGEGVGGGFLWNRGIINEDCHQGYMVT